MECPRCQKHISPEAEHCKWCGAIVPPSQHLLEDSGIVPRSTPLAVSAPRSPALFLATLGDRSIALLLDTAVLVELAAVFDLWLFLRWGRAVETEMQLTLATVLVAGFLNLLLCFTYMWLLEALFGATLGKVIVGIRVMNETERNDFSASAIRNVLRFVDGLGFYVVGILVASCSRMRRRLGDVCASTLVVAREFHPAIKMLAVALWLAALGGTIWFVPHLCRQSQIGQPPRYFSRTVVQIGRSPTSAYIRVARLKLEVQFNAPPASAPTLSTSAAK